MAPANQFKSTLPNILSYYSALPIKWGEDGERIRPGTVYFASRDHHMEVNGHIWPGPRINGSRPAADPLFTSVAVNFGSAAVGLVLTGNLHDGSEGAKIIAEAGGRVLTQDEATSAASYMPRVTIRNQCVDFVLPLSALAHALVGLFMVPGGAAWFKVEANHRAKLHRPAAWRRALLY